MKIEIRPATLRDLTYVAANLRPKDYLEVSSQLDGWSPTALAYMSLGEHAYCAFIDGQPVAGLGAVKVRRSLALGWSWGTKRMGRAVPAMIEHVHKVLIPVLVGEGILRCEARALGENIMAQRMLRRMGAKRECVLPCFGNDGEDFILYRWLGEEYPNVRQRDLRETETS